MLSQASRNLWKKALPPKKPEGISLENFEPFLKNQRHYFSISFGLKRSRRHPQQPKSATPAPESPGLSGLLLTRRPAQVDGGFSFQGNGKPHLPNDPTILNIVEKTCKSCWVGYALSLEIISIENQAFTICQTTKKSQPVKWISHQIWRHSRLLGRSPRVANQRRTIKN